MGKVTTGFSICCCRLGFYYGGNLPDPAKLLVGEGKRLRHIKIYSLEEAGRPEIGDFIKAVVEERQQQRGSQ